MGVKVHLYSGLKELTDGRDVIEVQGSSIGECMADLVKQFPRMKQEFFDEKGRPSGKVLVSVNLKSAYPEEWSRAIASGDELYVVRSIPGG